MRMQDISSRSDEGGELANTQLVDGAVSLSQAAMVASLLGITFAVVFFVIGVLCHTKAKKTVNIPTGKLKVSGWARPTLPPT